MQNVCCGNLVGAESLRTHFLNTMGAVQEVAVPTRRSDTRVRTFAEVKAVVNSETWDASLDGG